MMEEYQHTSGVGVGLVAPRTFYTVNKQLVCQGIVEGSSAAKDSLSEESKKAVTKTVSFATSVRCRVVDSLIATSEEDGSDSACDVRDIWFTPGELHRNRRFVKKSLLGVGMEDCDRFGGEGDSYSSSDNKKQRRKISVKAVLDEQERQRSMEDYDPGYIACLYRSSAKQSQILAHKVGKKDSLILATL